MSDCFHVGSYFMALRSDVIADPEFRRRLDMVAAPVGQELDHPQVRDRHLLLPDPGRATTSRPSSTGCCRSTRSTGSRRSTCSKEGFPFVKRQFLHENPFHVPDLYRWKERVLAAAPEADVEAFERNLWRVSPSFNLHRALSVTVVGRADATPPRS